MVSPFRELGCVAKLYVVILGFCAILGMPGCGGSGTGTPPEVKLTSIVVSPSTPPTIPVNGTIQFKATGYYSDGTTQDLTDSATWNSTDNSVATINAVGLATGVGQGSAMIKATQGTIFNESSSFSVTEPITAIVISPSNPSVAAGNSQQFTATATYADNSTGDVTNTVTWSSDTPSVATISNVAAFNGLATTFPVSAPPATAMISASSGGVSATPTILTVDSPAPVGLIVSPQNPVIADAGGTQQFKALAQYSDGSTQDVTSSATWSSTTSNNSNVAPVNSTGLVTTLALAAGKTAGFASISASWTAPGSGGAIKKSKKAASARSVNPQVSSGPTTLSGVSILSVTLHTGNGFAGTFTQHNDMYRTGQNINETALNSTTVKSGSFGKLFSQPVDGYVFAQPLYVPNVNFAAKGTHNTVYVATENDSVYAYDADSNTGANDATPLWKASLVDTAHGAAVGAAAATAPPTTSPDISCGNIANQIGITATPVIDPSTNTMYVEVESKENGDFVQRLHAIDITTGSEKSGWPITITGVVPGTSDGSTTVTFDPKQHLSRPGLLLLNGTVFTAFSSNCDNTPYHGWVFSYNVSTRAQTGVYSTTANGNQSTGGLGGIWMSGCGIAGDSKGNVYLVSGNGDFDTVNVPAVNTGDSILKFNQRGNTFSLVDYFTPSDQDSIDSADLDLGSGGLSLLPDGVGPAGHPNLIAQAGKNGDIFLVDRDQLTTNNQHYCSTCTTNNNVVQEIPKGVGGMWSMPAYWNDNVYFWGESDTLIGYSLSNGMLSTAPTASSILTLVYPGSVPTVSASSATANGIVWAIDATSQPKGAAVLYAFDAVNGLPGTFTELYKSQGVPADQAGPAVKFSIPTVANGKVYVGTQTEVDVYGKLP